MEDKIRKRRELHNVLKELRPEIMEAEQVLHRMKNNYNEIRMEYEALDREIAMVTKRTVVTGKSKQPELTLNQIEAIASKLGIVITKGGDES